MKKLPKNAQRTGDMGRVKKVNIWAIALNKEILGMKKETLLSVHLEEPITTQPVIFKVIKGEFVFKG